MKRILEMWSKLLLGYSIQAGCLGKHALELSPERAHRRFTALYLSYDNGAAILYEPG
jgi:hypothetical protein